jgi:nucleotide-binding universal stress UspA family protein
MTTILIGVDGSPGSDDALAFARPLAAASDADVVLVDAFRYDDTPSRASNLAFRNTLKKDAEDTLRGAAARLEGVNPERVKTTAVACTSPARALDHLATTHNAELIVVGSAHAGRLGRIVPGSTAERLLHGAPCPVAVVPKGYRPEHGGQRPQIGIAYDGSKESEAALHAATLITTALGGQLRVIKVFDATSYAAPAMMGGPGYIETRATIEQDVEAALDATIARLPEAVHPESVFLAGDVVHELVTQSTGLDLLVAGSRGYGPLRAVLLGGVTGRLIREAACPLLIVPRGHETPLADLFGAAVAASF